MVWCGQTTVMQSMHAFLRGVHKGKISYSWALGDIKISSQWYVHEAFPGRNPIESCKSSKMLVMRIMRCLPYSSHDWMSTITCGIAFTTLSFYGCVVADKSRCCFPSILCWNLEPWNVKDLESFETPLSDRPSMLYRRRSSRW